MTPLALFGGSGDLARAKVLPAILRLRRDGVFTAGSPLVFVARRPLDVGALLAEAAAKAPDAAGALPSLVADARSVELALGDEAAALSLAEQLPPGAAAYAALPPSAFPELIRTAGALFRLGRLSRLAVEKPLGRSGEEAAAAVSLGRAALGENFFLVDHYAWKAASRELASRAARGEANLPPASKISRLELSMRETIRVGRRAAFYDEVGATRDVFQSHGLFLLGLAIGAAAGVSAGEAIGSLAAVSAARARYFGYEEEGGASLDAETAARLALRSSLLPNAEIVAVFGKAFPLAEVAVRASSPAGEWRLSVSPRAAISSENGEEVSISAAREGYDAYEGALAAVLSGDFSGAPRPEDALAAWKVTDALRALAAATPLVRYSPGEEPAW